MTQQTKKPSDVGHGMGIGGDGAVAAARFSNFAYCDGGRRNGPFSWFLFQGCRDIPAEARCEQQYIPASDVIRVTMQSQPVFQCISLTLCPHNDPTR